ncbi:MAG: carbohydrate binding family 9 domain-containing protein [Acidobacteria bacterium]|nr:carbohydrate binding family 9 domain-containing protein [Acidobacteriota bacterium]
MTTTLYFAGTFADSDPRGPIIDDLKRDFEGRNGDIVGLSLDTFGDYSAYNFNVNAAGVLRDTQSYEDGRLFNANWDALWSASTQRSEGGWTLEMRVPFKSMRFPDAEEHDWAMNVFRLIRRKNEFTYWSPQPRQFTAYKISYGGRISGIRDVRSGRNLQIKPFYTGAASNLRLPSLDRRWDGDGGVDVKYGIGTSLALDLTLHTDFSQVEVDEQQINLTRFSLLFPEKREFFLENQGAFRIGDLSGRTLIPFFSRRVGLSDNGQPIPIIGGARLTGRQGDYTLGLLNIQTERFDGRPADNFSTFRAARNFGGSSIGGFYLGREASGPDFNRVAGADIRLNMRQTMELFAFAMRSEAAGAPGGSAGRASFSVSQRAYSADVSYTNISPEFRNDLGFISRGDIGLVAWDVARHFRSTRQGARLRVLSFGTLGERFDNSSHTTLNSRRVRAYSRLNFSDGGTLNVNADSNFERLLQPFQVSRNVAIAPGEYRFTQAIGGYTSNASNPLSFSADVTAGEFYSGTIRGVTGSVRWRVNTNLSASTSFESNAVDLTEGEFDTQVARFRLDYAFNPRMFLNSFVQYNNATSSWLTNVRYRFTYRPLSDFYLVYNDVRTAGRPDQRTFAIKHTLMLAF